jgi:hypothetical protein
MIQSKYCISEIVLKIQKVIDNDLGKIPQGDLLYLSEYFLDLNENKHSDKCEEEFFNRKAKAELL